MGIGRLFCFCVNGVVSSFLLVILIFFLNFRSFSEEAEWQYGTEVRFIEHSEIPGIRIVWLSSAKELEGTYEGTGSHPGDRRFGSYDRKYRIRIQATEASHQVSPINVEWWSQTENWAGDGSTADLAKFSVKDAKSNGSQIWGTMYATVEGKDQGPQFPFWAMSAEKEDGSKGIVLFGRYEGPVFLKKK